ncbi:MAG: nucleotidyltransferase family protein [Methyloceanibacter sp.]
MLAAGRSSRLAPRNKLLEPAGGKPMIRRVATNVLTSGVRPVIVVTGYEADRVAEALSGLEVTNVVNPSYAEGLSTSLRAGLEALPPRSDGALIFLGDMPEVEMSVIHALLASFTGPDAICVPVNRGQKGNPILWGSSYFAEMMTLTGDRGAKFLITSHADHLIEVDVATDSIFHDVDTPEDLARFKQRGADR